MLYLHEPQCSQCLANVPSHAEPMQPAECHAIGHEDGQDLQGLAAEKVRHAAEGEARKVAEQKTYRTANSRDRDLFLHAVKCGFDCGEFRKPDPDLRVFPGGQQSLHELY